MGNWFTFRALYEGMFRNLEQNEVKTWPDRLKSFSDEDVAAALRILEKRMLERKAETGFVSYPKIGEIVAQLENIGRERILGHKVPLENAASESAWRKTIDECKTILDKTPEVPF